MFKKILLVLVVVVAVLTGLAAMQPSHFQITRSMTMAASPAAVFAQVNDFHNWEAWSPWAKMDPNAKNNFEGPDAGEGAKFSWAGNDKVGEGKMTIVESKPNDLVKIKLEFLKPMTCTNDTLFTFKPEGDKTLMTWTMSGENGLIAKAFHLFMNVDKMVGADFEKGLTSIKQIVEAPAKP